MPSTRAIPANAPGKSRDVAMRRRAGPSSLRVPIRYPLLLKKLPPMNSLHSSTSPDELFAEPTEHLTERQAHWLRPPSLTARLAQRVLFSCNRTAMRLFFRLSSRGHERISEQRPCILAPNQTSSLDPSAIAAAVSLDQFRSLRCRAETRQESSRRRRPLSAGLCRDAAGRGSFVDRMAFIVRERQSALHERR